MMTTSMRMRSRPRRELEEDEDRALKDSVCYWRMSQPQVDAADSSTDENEDEDDGEEEEHNACEASADEYEVLYPSDTTTRQILKSSTFYECAMPNPDAASESLLAFCGSVPVRMGPMLLAALVRRFTDVRFNWETKTLQSFLEVTCWVSVTYAAYSLYEDWLWAFQVGTFVGALMSIGDEVVLQFVRGLARLIRNQSGGSELLQQLGFDVPLNGKAPTNGQEVELIKTLVFGYLGVVAIRALWTNFHDVKHFALLTAAVGVAFVVTAEFFCLWLPTRRIGLTLQSRFTQIRANWAEHTVRSFVELMAWTLSTSLFLFKSDDFLLSLQLGTLVAVGVCLLSGLEQLPYVVQVPLAGNRSTDVAGEQDGATTGAYPFWEEKVADEGLLMKLASGVVVVQDKLRYMQKAVEDEASTMMEEWSP